MNGPADPRLDDRSFADLMREAEAVIRRRAPGWTDFSAGDPGITLVEVFAYLTEVLLYRLNRVPDKVHLALLDLLGVVPLAPAAATVMLTFTREAEEEGAAPISIPAGTRVADAGGSVVFETLGEATLTAGPVEVPSVHAEQVKGESLGVGNGEPGQRVTLKRPPAIRNQDIEWALAVGVERGDEPLDRNEGVREDRGKSFVLWREVSSFMDVGPGDRVYVANRYTGQITFGPGAAGAVPAPGREIRAWYRRGGGRAGNVAAGRLVNLVDRIAGVTVTNKERAVGGEDGETEAAVVTRGREAVRVLRTAVTARDFERVALEAGGIARARAGALRELWKFAEPGVVGVQVVPQVDRDALPDRAVTKEVLAAHQGSELLARVASLLALRKAAGVETRESFTKCRPVSVAARVVVSEAEDPDRVGARLRTRLNDLLAPQSGWPHGKMLRASDVFEAILAEPGVRYAERLTLRIDEGPEKGVTTLLRDPHMPRSVLAGTSEGLFRAEDLARGWERLDTGESRRITAVAAHPEIPGLLAAVAEADGEINRLIVSSDVGETWSIVEQLQNEPVYDLAWVASRLARPVLLLATRRALRRLELGTGSGSVNVSELTTGGEAGGNGFFAVAAARHPMDVSFVAIAAREHGGVFISRAGGAKRSFELAPGSAGKDVRSLGFQTVGDRLFLWAGLAAAGGAEGEGVMRLEARADGLDPAGWTMLGKGWRGGSCEGFDIAGTTVVAASNRAGVLTLDLSAAEPGWSATTLDSGLPINNERSALLRVTSVAAIGGEPRPVVVAGSASGVFVARDGAHFAPDGVTAFTDHVPLPRTWLYCSGAHQLDVVTDVGAGEG